LHGKRRVAMLLEERAVVGGDALVFRGHGRRGKLRVESGEVRG
jgi:hypothetical protein